jgi:hypothetical protein
MWIGKNKEVDNPGTSSSGDSEVNHKYSLRVPQPRSELGTTLMQIQSITATLISSTFNSALT